MLEQKSLEWYGLIEPAAHLLTSEFCANLILLILWQIWNEKYWPASFFAVHNFNNAHLGQKAGGDWPKKNLN